METQNMGAVDSHPLNVELDIQNVQKWLHEDCIAYWRTKADQSPGIQQTLHMVDAHRGKAELIVFLQRAIKEHEANMASGGDPTITPFDNDIFDEARSILSTEYGRKLMVKPE